MKTGKGLYTIGLDFGTLSGRALLVDIGNGQVMGEAILDYPHGVLDSMLPSGGAGPARLGISAPTRLSGRVGVYCADSDKAEWC